MNHVEKATMSVFLSPDSAAGGHKKNDILFKMIEGNMSKKTQLLKGKNGFKFQDFQLCAAMFTKRNRKQPFNGMVFNSSFVQSKRMIVSKKNWCQHNPWLVGFIQYPVFTARPLD